MKKNIAQNEAKNPNPKLIRFDSIISESCSEGKKNRQSEKSFKNKIRKVEVLHQCKNIVSKKTFLGNFFVIIDKHLVRDHLLSTFSKREREKLASPAPFYVSAGRRPWSSWFKTDNMTASFEIWVLCINYKRSIKMNNYKLVQREYNSYFFMKKYFTALLI